MLKLKESVLNNGMTIYCLKDWEASNAAQPYYDHVQMYFDKFVQIKEGDTVLDVGANIGMYAISIYERYGDKVKVYAIEPIPEVYTALEANTARYSKETLIPVQKGISSRSGKVEFTYYPAAPSFSTLYPDLQQEEVIGGLMDYFDQLEKSGRLDEWPSNIQETIDNIKNNDALSEEKKERAIKMETMLAIKNSFRAQKVECELTTISEVIEEYKLDKIDVLKLHVEHSELDIFKGIKEEDWDKVKQVVVQIEGLDTDVIVEDVLRKHNFTNIESVILEEIEAFSTIIVYAAK